MVRIALVCLVSVSVAARASAQDKVDLKVREFPKHVDEKTHKAIEAGLKWLAANQAADGHWGGNSNAYGGDFPVAMTALAGLAFLSHGDTPDRGTYAQNVRMAMTYLLRVKTEKGMMTSPGEAQRPMYGHGFAMLFLGELYGMEGGETVENPLGEKIRKRLEEGVKLIAAAQSNRGGWFYTPAQSQAGEDEGSVTVTAVQALRSAKNAGIPVDKKVIDRGIQYILDCQEPDGGIRYSFVHRHDSRPAISAAAVATLYSAGAYDTANDKLSESERRGIAGMKRCLRYCDETFSGRIDPTVVQGFMFYTHLYLSQAMWSSGDKHWDKYYPEIRRWLLEDPRNTRQPDGSWMGDNPGPGKVYGTAVALMILQIPYQYLPILQR